MEDVFVSDRTFTHYVEWDSRGNVIKARFHYGKKDYSVQSSFVADRRQVFNDEETIFRRWGLPFRGYLWASIRGIRRPISRELMDSAEESS